jgi:hypothetical protein
MVSIGNKTRFDQKEACIRLDTLVDLEDGQFEMSA